MSLDYHLTLGGPLSPAQALNILAALPGFTREDGDLAGPGVMVHIRTADEEDAASSLRRFGFPSTLSILFTQDKFADPALSRAAIVTAVRELLSQAPGDAVFDLNSDCVILRRRRERLDLEQNDDFWQPDLVRLLTRG